MLYFPPSTSFHKDDLNSVSLMAGTACFLEHMGVSYL